MKDRRLEEVYRAKINLETARIAWKELQRFFASGKVILAAPGLDLVEVAYQISEDNSYRIAHWMSEGKLGKVSDEQALNWYQTDVEVWAVVVSPYVLIQEVKDVLHS